MSEKFVRVFHLWPEGPDSDYGVINSETVKVTVEQSWEWEPETIQDMKEYLSDFYDVPVGRVATEEDLAEETAYWEREAEKMKNEKPFEHSPAGKIDDLPF